MSAISVSMEQRAATRANTRPTCCGDGPTSFAGGFPNSSTCMRTSTMMSGDMPFATHKRFRSGSHPASTHRGAARERAGSRGMTFGSYGGEKQISPSVGMGGGGMTRVGGRSDRVSVGRNDKYRGEKEIRSEEHTS